MSPWPARESGYLPEMTHISNASAEQAEQFVSLLSKRRRAR